MARERTYIPEIYRSDLAPYPSGYQPRCIGIYSRISFDKHGRATGVDRQDGLLERAVTKAFPDAEIVHYQDNDRGASLQSRDERPDYERLVMDVSAGKVDAVAVKNVDRWTRRSREMLDSLDWITRLNLVWLTLTKDGRLEFDGRAALLREAIRAEEEATTIGQRTADAAYWRRVNGEVGSSRAPFGYMLDSTPDKRGLATYCTYRTPHPVDSEIVKALFHKASEGMAPAGLLAWLRTQKTGTQHAWSSATLNTLLHNPIYAGLVPYRGKPFMVDDVPVTAVDMVPLVELSTWQEVQRQIGSRPKVNGNGGKRRHVLAGMVICSCGKPMQAQVFTQQRKVPKPDPTQGFTTRAVRVGRWYCLSRLGGCGSMARNYDHVWWTVKRAVTTALDEERPGAVTVQREDPYAGKIAEIERKIVALDAAVAAGLGLDETDVSRLKASHRSKIRTLELQRSSSTRQRRAITAESREKFLLLLDDESPESLWDRRELIERFIDHVLILPARKGRGMDPQAIRVVPR